MSIASKYPLSCEKISGKIYTRHHDNRLERCERFPIVFGKIVSFDTGYKDVYDKFNIEPVYFDNVYAAKDYLLNNENVYGNENLEVQFLNQFDKNTFDYSAHSILSIDIETDYDETRPFIRGDYSGELISCAFTFYNKGITKKVCFGLQRVNAYEEFDYIYCKSEFELLMNIVQFIKFTNPTVITGWNISGFDLPYIVNRLELYDVSGDILSPFYNLSDECLISLNGDEVSKIAGINVIDYAPLFKTYTQLNLLNNKLDTVADEILGYKKVEYEKKYGSLKELYKRNPRLFYEYNVTDTSLVIDLELKLRYIRIAMLPTSMGGVPFSRYSANSDIWDAILWKVANKRKKFIPPKTYHVHTPYTGGYVKDTMTGMFRNICTFDAESLYPTIIRIGNMSFDRYVGQDVEGYYFRSPNGACFDVSSDGILTEAITEQFRLKQFHGDEKKRYKKLYKETNNPEYLTLLSNEDDLRQAVKILINALYGLLGYTKFRYYNVHIVEAVTTVGANINKYMMHKMNNHIRAAHGLPENNPDSPIDNNYIDSLEYIVGGDTDSFFANFDGIADTENLNQYLESSVIPLFREWTQEVTNILGAKNNYLNYQREKIIKRGIYRAKKNYALSVYDDEGTIYKNGKLTVKGLEAVKGSYPNHVRKKLLECYNLTLHDEFDKLKETVTEYRNWFFEQSVNDTFFTQYVSDIESNTPAGKGAKAFNKSGIGTRLVASGEKVRWTYLLKNNPWQSETLSFVENVPEYVTQYQDKEAMFDKVFLNPLNTVITHAGISVTGKPEKRLLF